jgi:hypothetical protein
MIPSMSGAVNRADAVGGAAAGRDHDHEGSQNGDCRLFSESDGISLWVGAVPAG